MIAVLKNNTNPLCLMVAGLFRVGIVLLILVSTNGFALEFNQLIAFGDSTIDSGYFRYNKTPIQDVVLAAVSKGASGAFVGSGEMNTTLLANKLGLNAKPVGAGGFNYANGGALTYYPSVYHPPGTSVEAQNIPTVTQIHNYLRDSKGVANPKALYLISTGSNDLTHKVDLHHSAKELAKSLAQLQASGAKSILVVGNYNYAVLAGKGGVIPPSKLAFFQESLDYQQFIWNALQAAGVKFIPVDENRLFQEVVQNPLRYGFTADSVLSPNAPCAGVNSALLCTTMTPAQMQQYLFVDGVHFTTAGQAIEADYAYSLLLNPPPH